MGRPTITVLCPTGHRGPLVAETLGALRGAVDEIVIAADARVEATDLAYYADVADTLLRYEHAGPNRHWPWLAEQASGDWVLILDGDELVGTALIEALPELVVDRRVRQYSLPIHWPWPSAARRVAEEPWEAGWRLRLVRNEAGLGFAARKHALAYEDPPIRHLEELPVYHLDLIMPDRARREAKVAHYDNQVFGLLTPEGLPFNQAFYLPEAREEPPATVPIPPADAERIARALGAPRDESRALDPETVSLAGREEVAWYAPRVVLPDDAYRATIAVTRPLPSFTAGRPDHLVWLEITNAGTARWPGGDSHDPLVRLGMAWQPVGGGPRQDVGRAMLPHRLDPGQSALFPAFLAGPTAPGSAELVLDLVHENVRWFERPFSAAVEVGPSAEQRLAALVERHGPLVPVEALMVERRAIGAADALLRPGGPAEPPSDDAIAALVASLPVGAWAVDAPAIDRLVELVREARPAAIVEFGSGTSSVVLASLLAELHGDGLRLLSFEQDPAWAEHTRAALAARGLDATARVVHVPVGERGEGPPGYLLNDEATALLADLAPELVFVDGPTLVSGASRLGAVEIVAPHLREDAILLLDDALRDAELCVAEAWERREDVIVHGIRPTPKGLLEATLCAPRRRRGLIGSALGRRRG
jgi:predicted O-methyltransferase YrrM